MEREQRWRREGGKNGFEVYIDEVRYILKSENKYSTFFIS